MNRLQNGLPLYPDRRACFCAHFRCLQQRSWRWCWSSSPRLHIPTRRVPIPKMILCPFVQPGLQIGGRSEIRLVDLGATVTCGAHYWLDVAGATDVIDALLVRLLHADGTFFAERRA